MTNYGKIRSMTVEQMAAAILKGISSDPCDYCEHSQENCSGVPCNQKLDEDIIVEWLESEESK